MAHRPTPILIVSASFNRGELFDTYSALAAGAVDVLDKPATRDDDGVGAALRRRTLRLVSKIKVITHPRGRLGAIGRARAITREPPARGVEPDARRTDVIALGASTGGPGALADGARARSRAGSRCRSSSSSTSTRRSRSSFADWLGKQTGRTVRLATRRRAARSVAGEVLIAPPDRHLVVARRGASASIDDAAAQSLPAVDRRAVRVARARTTARARPACLLTGMGRDGADGLARDPPRRRRHDRAGRSDERDLRDAARGGAARCGRARAAARTRSAPRSISSDGSRDDARS